MEKVQFKIGGMSCSFCTETIKRAVGRIEGVHEVHVSLAHEETLIVYDPFKVAPQEFKKAITDVGYTVQDPDKVRTFEEQQEELQRERDRLIIAASLTGVALLLMLLMWVGRMFPYIEWITLGLALLTVFIVGRPILKTGWASLRRGILNQTRSAGVRSFCRACWRHSGAVLSRISRGRLFRRRCFRYHLPHSQPVHLASCAHAQFSGRPQSSLVFSRIRRS